MKNAEEMVLLQQMKKNSNEALSTIYDKYAGAIYGVICREISDTNEAAKIVRDVFVQFALEAKQRQRIDEGIFICLLRLAKKLICKRLLTPPPSRDINAGKTFNMSHA